MKYLVLVSLVFASSMSFAKSKEISTTKWKGEGLVFQQSFTDKVGEIVLTATELTDEKQDILEKYTIHVEVKCAPKAGKASKPREVLRVTACHTNADWHREKAWNPTLKELTVSYFKSTIAKNGAAVCDKDGWDPQNVSLAAACED